MIASARCLADVIAAEIPDDAFLTDAAADLVPVWLLDVANRGMREDGHSTQRREPEITGTGVGP